MTELMAPAPPAISRPPSRDHLIARFGRVLSFCSSVLSDIEGGAPGWSEEIDPLFTFGDKAVVESGLLLLLASRVESPSSRVCHLTERLAEALAPLTFTPRHLELLRRFPQTAVPFGIPYVALRETSEMDQEFERALASALSDRTAAGFERLPHRALEVEWIGSLVLNRRPAGTRDLERTAVVDSSAHPIYMTVSDVYALTHAVMYATDFGRLPCPPAWRRSAVSGLVDACIAWALASEHYDLLAELLFTAAALRAWTDAAELGGRLFLATWDELGYLPSPTFDRTRYRTLSGAEARTYGLREHYHTQYVAGVLAYALFTGELVTRRRFLPGRTATVSLGHACLAAGQKAVESLQGSGTLPVGFGASNGRDDTPIPGTDRTRGIALGLLAMENLQTNARHRERLIASAAWDWRSATSILVDAALIQAAREYRLGSVAHVLSAAARLGTRFSPTMHAATSFLIRQLGSDGVIDAPQAGQPDCSAPSTSSLTAGLATALLHVGSVLGRCSAA